MADQPVETVEADTAIGRFKISSANLNTLFTVMGFVLLCLVAWTLYAHATDAKDSGKVVAQELKEANKEVASALKESNKEISKVLNDLAQAMRERNCLESFTPQKRAENADLCKRLSR